MFHPIIAVIVITPDAIKNFLLLTVYQMDFKKDFGGGGI